MKKIEDKDAPPNWGCPNTEMRTRGPEFEASEAAAGLDLKFNTNGPHYRSHKTRIAFYEWECKNPPNLIRL
jgi:hypothetical protein